MGRVAYNGVDAVLLQRRQHVEAIAMVEFHGVSIVKRPKA
jgi:hypothetical protein